MQIPAFSGLDTYGVGKLVKVMFSQQFFSTKKLEDDVYASFVHNINCSGGPMVTLVLGRFELKVSRTLKEQEQL